MKHEARLTCHNHALNDSMDFFKVVFEVKLTKDEYVKMLEKMKQGCVEVEL